jgi:hypothetical protein
MVNIGTHSAWLHVSMNMHELQELAAGLLRRRFEAPALWQSFQPYWDSLPAKGRLCGMNSFQSEHLDMFQDARLVRLTPSVTGHAPPADLFPFAQHLCTVSMPRAWVVQERLVRTVMNWTEEVFSGQGGRVQAGRSFAPLMAKYPDAAAIGVDDIRHYATLVSAFFSHCGSQCTGIL